MSSKMIIACLSLITLSLGALLYFGPQESRPAATVTTRVEPRRIVNLDVPEKPPKRHVFRPIQHPLPHTLLGSHYSEGKASQERAESPEQAQEVTLAGVTRPERAIREDGVRALNVVQGKVAESAPKLSDEDISALVAKESQYRNLGWRKFISESLDFAVWVPSQLFAYTPSTPQASELYISEHEGVLYAVQYGNVSQSSQGSATAKERLLRKLAEDWAEVYLKGIEDARLTSMFFTPARGDQPPFLEVRVLAKFGQSRLRILLVNESTFYFWTAFRSEDAPKQQLPLFADSLEILR